MTTLLHFFPGTCAQVTAVALEETGIEYQLALADMRTPETRADFRHINPAGKVPALEIEGRLLVENTAILWFLDARVPGRLFAESDDPFDRQRRLADLAWCASTMHPIVRQVRMPQLWTTGDPAPVNADGTEKMQREAADIEERVSAAGWWYGAEWSIVDTYLWWCFRNVQRGNMDLGTFPRLVAYLDRIEQRPSTLAVLQKQVALGVTPIPSSLERSAQPWR